ncbi:response regulator [Parathalassolituus penaei]|uniref:Response regulator n=1 Tax=Parathalassolituus penaei TaxID=2997323 RepID=A0A9X3ECV0_9GAMM|nr:response regulator [Parathalassolituus penaei]MCY0964811.1 response regulator [Parathalassolituus penaei]
MTDRAKVLIIDDSPNEIRILMEVLRDEFAVLGATSGEQAMALLQKSRPDLVLLDAVMEPMDGYELCARIQSLVPGLPVIFVSVNARTEEILKGYDAGGQDYVTKPIEPDLLRKRVRFCLQQARELAQLQSEKQEVSSMAMAALGSAADIGIVLNFVREGIKLGSQALLVHKITRTLADYGLAGLAQVRSGDQFWNASTNGQVGALEAEVLRRSRFMDRRLFAQGKRLIINYDFVTLLIKNHPSDNPKRAGELCDYLTILGENANDLIQKIRDDLSVSEQRVCLVLDALRDSQNALAGIQAFQKQYKSDSMLLMNQLSLEVEEEFVRLDLTEQQEQAISAIIQRKLNEALEMAQGGLQLDEQLQRVTDSLGELTRSF